MKPTKQQKIEQAKELAKLLGKSPNLYITQYQGLKFIELAQLRSKLKPFKCKYQVVKNSLIANALKEAGVPAAPDAKTLKGPIGIIIAPGTDPVSAAKTLMAFAKEFPLLKVKAGYVGDQWLNPADCAKLSTLGTKPELLSKLAGTLYATVAQSAGVLQAPLRDFVLVLKALEEKKKKEPQAAAPAAA
ncbi:MAG: 50S ribosomal protein L10 [Elusimicrobia bacterium]|nr:50S ribosomal protein L10 [Elusimicrobiota bacterium]